MQFCCALSVFHTYHLSGSTSSTTDLNIPLMGKSSQTVLFTGAISFHSSTRKCIVSKAVVVIILLLNALKVFLRSMNI